jgi:nitrate reductase gamma subunit
MEVSMLSEILPKLGAWILFIVFMAGLLTCMVQLPILNYDFSTKFHFIFPYVLVTVICLFLWVRWQEFKKGQPFLG